ncbi:phosphate ABC transporter substrate-binding protein [Polaromonas hydrogenivorans]|uniref:Phosphate ABC transporter substrate-binding protein n=1 Tax=Polaromonas hydrogenivorans TaxID=335476 RepID=A0AAU7LYD9_9BURK
MFHIRFTVLGLALGLGASVAAADVVVVVLVVSAKNPMATMNKNQVADIFLGKTSRFPDGRQAVPIDLAESSAARDEFYLNVTGKSPSQLKAHWAKIIFTGRGEPPLEVANGAELKKRMADNPNVLGYIERNMVDDSVRVVLVP